MPSILFDSETARKNALKSAEIRRKLGEERRAQLKRLNEAPLPSQIPQAEPAKPPYAEYVRELIMLVDEQITQAREALNDKTPWCPHCERAELQPHHRAQLMKSLESFIDRKRSLLGIPSPGSFRPRQEKARKSADIEPEA